MGRKDVQNVAFYAEHAARKGKVVSLILQLRQLPRDIADVDGQSRLQGKSH